MANQIGQNKQFGGWNRRFKVPSTSLGCDTTFTIYFPPAAETKKRQRQPRATDPAWVCLRRAQTVRIKQQPFHKRDASMCACEGGITAC
eukprot:351609-Chlamydomonas_euryale.AAC.9